MVVFRHTPTFHRLPNLAKLVLPELRSDLYIGLLDQPTSPAFISALFRKFSKNRGKPVEQNISESVGYAAGSLMLRIDI